MEKDFLEVLTHLKTKYGVILEPYPSIPDRMQVPGWEQFWWGGNWRAWFENEGVNGGSRDGRGAGLKYLSFPKNSVPVVSCPHRQRRFSPNCPLPPKVLYILGLQQAPVA
jgi:hypothetical protein